MDAGGRSRGILKVQVSRTRLQSACKDRTNPGKREHYGRYSSIPTNVPPDLMRDVLPAADAPAAEAHHVCPQCHPQCRLPALAKLAQLAPLTTTCCVKQSAQTQYLVAREPHESV